MRVWVSSSCRMMLGLSGLMVPSLVFFAGLVLSAGCSGGGWGPSWLSPVLAPCSPPHQGLENKKGHKND